MDVSFKPSNAPEKVEEQLSTGPDFGFATPKWTDLWTDLGQQVVPTAEPLFEQNLDFPFGWSQTEHPFQKSQGNEEEITESNLTPAAWANHILRTSRAYPSRLSSATTGTTWRNSHDLASRHAGWDDAGELSELSTSDALTDIFGPAGLASNDALRLAALGIPQIMDSFARELGIPPDLALEVGDFARNHHLEIAYQINRRFHNGALYPIHGKQAVPNADMTDIWETRTSNVEQSLSLFAPSSGSASGRASTGCEWFVSRFLKEAFLHPPTHRDPESALRIRRLVMDELLLRISPEHQAEFTLPRATTRFFEKEDNMHQPLAERIVLTCSSPGQLQATTIKQYMDQTWPYGGTLLLGVLQSELQRFFFGI
ncbi:hypothetical protein C8A00DRAFT_33235 [Chaetomidium leptoderma]|uniref:Uncharacterized protein n=1 Tax=Chaetomidium leptoderma TaxID=669021 RepID=A0AAN6ZWZ9_9PEZI|nr:hypothetical protein C8A00DRAFT_33235 [Chaetomidium leptoderma]